MKINRIFAAAMAATFMLSSCMNENETGAKGGDGTETYAGVTISIPEMTRAMGDSNASSAECVISSVGVYIVDQTTNAIHSAVLTSSDFTQAAADGKVTATKAVKTTTGTKNVYVITNPTAALTTIIEGQRNLAFKNIQTLGETGYYSITSGNLTSMVMSGSKIGHDMTTVVTEANAVLPANLLKIDVKRNTARVVLKEKVGGIVVDGGTASNIEFAMVAKNKGSYISETQTTANGTPYNAVPTSALTDPDDPYFANFSTVTPVSTDYLPIVAAATAKDAAKGFYVLENTTDNKRIGNTTAVSVKLKYTPTAAKGSKIIASWAAATGPVEGALDASGTFYVYTGGDNSYWTKAAYQAATASAIPATDFSEEYTGGIGYYKIYVAASNDGEKCVLRNYYYEMTLGQVKGPGQPTVPGDGEEDEPVENFTWLGVELSMTPWTFSPTEWIVQ